VAFVVWISGTSTCGVAKRVLFCEIEAFDFVAGAGVGSGAGVLCSPRSPICSISSSSVGG
jgi:hypothetical protein